MTMIFFKNSRNVIIQEFFMNISINVHKNIRETIIGLI
jgi:hypothetical protein